MPDVWATIADLDAAVQDRLAGVLETRGADVQQQAMRRAFLSEVEFGADARVLEVGCGTGVLTRLLARWPAVAAVVGVDVAGMLLAKARALTSGLDNVTFEEADARSLPFEDESFDVVVFRLDAHSRAGFTAAEDLVFPNEVGEHLCGWTLRRRYYAALDAAGLPRLRFHDLRHCFATIAVQRLPLHTVQGFLGTRTSAPRCATSTTRCGPRRGAPLRTIRAETVLISGHARDTLAAVGPSQTVADGAITPTQEEAPTGIEPVYTALQEDLDSRSWL